nr:unnamed protein product [Callosobruchus chinensis]
MKVILLCLIITLVTIDGVYPDLKPCPRPKNCLMICNRPLCKENEVLYISCDDCCPRCVPKS